MMAIIKCKAGYWSNNNQLFSQELIYRLPCDKMVLMGGELLKSYLFALNVSDSLYKAQMLYFFIKSGIIHLIFLIGIIVSIYLVKKIK